jgi:hypothetical protein
MAQFRCTYHYERTESADQSASVRRTIHQNQPQKNVTISAASGDSDTLKAVLVSNSLGAPSGTVLIIDAVANHDTGCRHGGTVLS